MKGREHMRHYTADADASKADIRENMRYRGIGMVSANGSSRLLIDYKVLHPDVYEKILRYIFGKEGLGVTHLKLEMGSDVNSSSGTEPAVMRSRGEKADVRRGAGFVLAHDAKKIAPDLTLDMLFWSEPRWVTDSKDIYKARYEWYKQNLIAAYEQLGLRFDYVSLVRNERAHDAEWIKYFVCRLKAEKELPYAPETIRTVGGEEVCTWGFADLVMCDSELKGMIDVVGSHYTSSSSENAHTLGERYGKELWFSEASPPMSYAEGAVRLGNEGSGLAGLNGVLDVIDRFIAMYPCGAMTMCELQPVIASYYDGVTYCHKQLIRACEPWSGAFSLDIGFYAFLHISQFIDKGWAFIPEGCFNDGEVGGDGHALTNVTKSCMTVCDPQSGDVTLVITNSLNETVTYDITGLSGKRLGVWETVYGSERSVLKKREDIIGTDSVSVDIPPFSIVTVSTREPYNTVFSDVPDGSVMALPYCDSFSYSDEFLSLRGNAPLYTTDQGGAFEVGEYMGRRMLIQQITPDMIPEEWGLTPEPVTSFGDDRWYDMSLTADIAFAESKSSGCYIGVGVRYALAAEGQHGWWIKLFSDGRWELIKTHDIVLNGIVRGFDSGVLHRIKLSAAGRRITALLEGKEICALDEECPFIGAGRAALYSSYDRNAFGNIEILPESEGYFIKRLDCTDECIGYSGEWRYDLMSSFKDLNRTISYGKRGCGFDVSFKGTELAVTGRTERARLMVSVDGGNSTVYDIPECSYRERSLTIAKLKNGSHRITLEIVGGEFSFDGIEVENV